MRYLLPLFLSVVLLGAAPSTAMARSGGHLQATPTGEPVDPALCQQEPRPVSFFAQYLATPGASPVASPSPRLTLPAPERSSVPDGEPADAATIAAVTDTAREVLACLNARDQRRAAALFTDGYFDRLFARSGRLPADALAGFAVEPIAAPEPAWTRFVDIRDVRVLPDERVAAVIVTDDPVSPPLGPQAALLVFAEAGDRWLVDEPIVTLPPLGTPVAPPGPRPTPVG